MTDLGKKNWKVTRDKVGRLSKRLVAMFIMAVTIILSCFGTLSMDVNAKGTTGLTVSPKASGTIKINLLVASIDPTLTSINGKNYHNGRKTISASEYFGFSLDDSVDFWINNFEEISHQTVDINVVDKFVIDEFPQYKSQPSLNNTSFQQIFEMDNSGHGKWYEGVTSDAFKPYDSFGDLDYQHYIDKLDLVNKKNAGEFDMLLLVGIDPLSPYETCMVGRKPFWINGGAVNADCDNFVIVTPTFSRLDGSIENVGHMAENMLGYTYGDISYTPGCIDGSNYNALNDWEKFCLCEYLATPGTQVYGYGMVHFSPNSKADYDWSNNTKVKYYKDWRNGSDIQDFTANDCYLNNPAYNQYSDPTISHHRWWFSNMPYADGRDKDGYYNNWWRYIFTPDFVTGLSGSSKYTNGKINLTVKEEKSVEFVVEYYSGKKITTNIADSSAAVVLGDSSLVKIKDGKLVGLAAGTEEIEIKIDGKSLKYTVTVTKNGGTTPNPDNGGSGEDVANFVERLYTTCLGRASEKDGKAYWIDELMCGTTGSDVAYKFFFSQEFTDHKFSNDEYVTRLYRTFMDREPDASGKAYWLDYMKKGGSREDVFYGFINSVEWANVCLRAGIKSGGQGVPTITKEPSAKVTAFAERLYTTCLGRKAEAGGLKYWSYALANVQVSGSEAAYQFFFSDEFINANYSNDEFIKRLYRTFMDREPEANGYKYWKGQLDSGKMDRQAVFTGFAGSEEFKQKCLEAGIVR